MQIFRVYFSSSLGVEISIGPSLQTETFVKEFQPFAKEVRMIFLS